MIIKALRIELNTAGGLFGFKAEFIRHLNIIRGDNSSGKSTVYNSLIYSLGMEELIGGKGPRSLPYAVKDFFIYEGSKISILSSRVFLEIENKNGEIVTITRVISDQKVDQKLIEIYEGPALSENIEFKHIKSTYVHDSGGATKEEGFHQFLENFLELRLPLVPLTNGNQTKLYLQTIFAAFIVEQKRGWSDYIANIPYYGIRDARSHVVEYLLNLNVFENSALRNSLDKESIRINGEWDLNLKELIKLSRDNGIIISEAPNKPVVDFDGMNLSIGKHIDNNQFSLATYIFKLNEEYEKLNDIPNQDSSGNQTALSEIEKVMEDIQTISHTYESMSSRELLLNASLNEYKNILLENREDLERNKAALKLKNLGALSDIQIAKDICPTCQQQVDDSLLHQITSGHHMGLNENIDYLSRQSEMLLRQMAGVEIEVRDTITIKLDLARRIDEKRSYLFTLKKQAYAGESDSKARYKRQIQIEDEIRKVQRVSQDISIVIAKLITLSEALTKNRLDRKALPRDLLSVDDISKIDIFQSYLRSNCSAFGYTSANIHEIEINHESFTPYLEAIELKEIRQDASTGPEKQKDLLDIKSDSSASDFVRLIWSYLLSLYQTSEFSTVHGNHPGILLFDEPGQHSMGELGQKGLLSIMSGEKNLQSIIAASFEESDTVFKEVTDGINFKLIRLSKKFIEPLAPLVNL
jgi:hypothetical protein